MRTLPGGIPISDAITRPVWLLTLDFAAGMVRYSSRETVTISGTTYIGAGFVVTQLVTTPNGDMRCDVVVPSHDGGFRTLINNDEFRGNAATLGIVYGESGWTSGDIVPIFDGVMDGAPEIAEHVRLSMVSTGHATEFSPRHFAQPPYFNHVPAPGAKLVWGEESYILPGESD